MSSLNLYGLDPFSVEGPPMKNLTKEGVNETMPMSELQLKTPLVNVTQIEELITK